MTGEKHPKGLYVLFATEMWERFSFYSMIAMFTLYMRNPEEAALVSTPDGRARYATAITDGIMAWLTFR